MFKYAIKKLPFVIRCIPDWFKTQQRCDKGILENGRILKFVPDCYKDQEMCDKGVNNYPQTLKFVLDCYKSLQYNLFLNAVRPKKCVIKLLIYIFLHLHFGFLQVKC